VGDPDVLVYAGPVNGGAPILHDALEALLRGGVPQAREGRERGH
jgi:hypothetical protein